MISHRELLGLKNLSCSPMSFATKILFKIFKIEELHGHNVSGKTLNKNQKAKLPLDTIRIGYIRFLVERYYDEKECREMLSGTSNKQDLWKSCHTAINKSILISERKAAAAAVSGVSFNPGMVTGESENDDLNKSLDTSHHDSSESDIEIEPKIVQQRRSRKLLNEESELKRRISTRVRTPNKKFKLDFDDDDDENSDDFDDEFDDSDDEDDEDDDDETENINNDVKINNGYPLDIEIKEEDEVPNEIELIQNIENRINNSKQTIPTPNKQNSMKPNGAKLPLTIISPQVNPVPVNNTPQPQPQPQPQQPQQQQSNNQSSEASAAANIAAAMKKRFVVIAACHKPNSN